MLSNLLNPFIQHSSTQWSFAKEISVGTIPGEGMGGDLTLGFPQTFRTKKIPNDLFRKKIFFPPKISDDHF